MFSGRASSNMYRNRVGKQRSGGGAGESSMTRKAFGALNEALNPVYKEDSDREGILGMKDPNDFYQQFNFRKSKHMIRLLVIILLTYLLTLAINLLVGPNEESVRDRHDQDLENVQKLLDDELDFLKREHESNIKAEKETHESVMASEKKWYLEQMEELNEQQQSMKESYETILANLTAHSEEHDQVRNELNKLQKTRDKITDIARDDIAKLKRSITNCKSEKSQLESQIAALQKQQASKAAAAAQAKAAKANSGSPRGYGNSGWPNSYYPGGSSSASSSQTAGSPAGSFGSSGGYGSSPGYGRTATKNTGNTGYGSNPYGSNPYGRSGYGNTGGYGSNPYGSTGAGSSGYGQNYYGNSKKPQSYY